MKKKILSLMIIFSLLLSLSGCGICPHIGTHVERAREATCIIPGYTGDTVCNLCKAVVEKGDVIHATGHKVEVTGAVKGSCTEEGRTGTGICAVCGAVIFTDEPIPAEGHKEELINAVEATCQSEGYTGDLVCTVCGEVFEKGETIPVATTHVHTETRDQKASTCSEHGYSGDVYCLDCGQLVQKGEELELEDHVTEIRGAKASTCTVAGSTGTEVCIVCGQTVRAARPTALANHRWVKDEAESVAPTCTESGTDHFTCSVCGTEMDEEVDPLGHSWEKDDAESVAPTCTAEGKDHFVCAVCGAEKDEAVDPLGHDYQVTTPATCTEAGEKTCSRCGDVQAISALGHSWDEGTVSVEPTCADKGAHVYKCTVCGETTIRYDIDATGDHDTVLVGAREATETTSGYTGDLYCTVCHQIVEQGQVIPATGGGEE